MKSRTIVAGLLLSTALSASAQESVKILIQTKPEGAVVKRNTEELGLSGTPFHFALRKLGTGNLYLQLERKNYKPHQLIVPSSTIRFGAVDGVVTFPESPAQLEPLHPLVPLQENPLLVVLGLGTLAGLGVLARRRLVARKELEKHDALGQSLKDQVEDHDALFSKVGSYRLLELLGEGGMAKVYRAVPDETRDEDQAVALKVLHPHLCKEEEHNQRFVREGRVSKDLIHPNIVRLFELDSDDDLVYIVLELMNGETLREKLAEAPLSLQVMKTYLDQIFCGLVYAHDKGVVHRDLTPRNIMVMTDGTIKLMDFGLARRREVDKTITVTGAIQGTPGYMAPEQLSEAVDARSDQYALGVICYEMLTGRRPIVKEDTMQQIMATFTEDAPDPRDFRADIPEPVALYVLRLLQREPDDRFENMEMARMEFNKALGASDQA